VKFLLWCCGVMVILDGAQVAWAINRGWRWVWVALGIYWFFVGAGYAFASLAKLATAKWRMGAASNPRQRVTPAPSQSKEE